MSAKLVAMPQRKIVRAINSEKRVKAAGSKFEDVLNAFDDAIGHVMRDIVVATLTTPVSPAPT
jgi:cholesterol transport system auxiliary component